MIPHQIFLVLPASSLWSMMGQTIELSYWLDLNSWKCRRFVRIVGDTLHALRKIRLDTSERPSKIGSQSEPTKNGGTYQVGWRQYRTKWGSRHTSHQWKLEFGKTFWSKRYLAWKIGVFTFLKPSLIRLFTTLNFSMVQNCVQLG